MIGSISGCKEQNVYLLGQQEKNLTACCRGNYHTTVNAHWSKVIFSGECKVVNGQDSCVSV